MIEELVKKKSVLELLEKVQLQLEEGQQLESVSAEHESVPAELESVPSGSDSDALADIKASLKREKLKEPGPGLETPGEGSDQAEQDDDELFYLPSDPVVSITQSCAEYVQDVRRQESQTEPGETTDDDITGLEALEPFSQTDVGWVSSLVAMGIRKFKNRHPDGDLEPAPQKTISNKCRIVMIGDWGSGIKRAQKISSIAREIIDQGKQQGIEQHVVHLGDVYYSGFGWEYEKRFLPYWPVKPEESREIGSFSLNANHDMYAGGYGYFDVLMNDDRFKQWHQGSSKFSIANDHWRILGIDTAYEDHGLHGNQDEWVKREGEQAQQNQQNMMLLSHHQPFSIYEQPKDSNPLRQKIKTIADQGLIHSWFWGHEHRCVVYDDFENIKYGRCAGHSGVPVYMWDKKQSHSAKQPHVKYEYRDVIRKSLGIEKFAVFGLIVLEIDGPSIEARYINERNVEHYTEIIS